MQKINQGDIVFAPFPYSDLSDVKKRPLLVISNNNDFEIIIVKITSTLNMTNAISIKPLDVNFTILKPSVVKYKSISTIDKNIIIKKIGSVNKIFLEKIIDKIKLEIDVF